MFKNKNSQTFAEIIAGEKYSLTINSYDNNNPQKNCTGTQYQYFYRFKGFKKSPGYFCFYFNLQMN